MTTYDYLIMYGMIIPVLAMFRYLFYLSAKEAEEEYKSRHLKSSKTS